MRSILPDPHAPPSSLKGCPYPKRMTNGNPDIFTEKQPTPQQTREAIAAYYACVSFVDDNVGRILAALDKQALTDNTIVFILGDHGFHLGDHGGLWAKLTDFERAARVPLAIVTPHSRHAGRASSGIVESLDLYPTLVDLCGLPKAEGLEGVLVAGVLVLAERRAGPPCSAPRRAPPAPPGSAGKGSPPPVRREAACDLRR